MPSLITPMQLTLAQLASALSLTISAGYSEKLINNILLDSRRIVAGDVFVALMGEHVDGHDFVALAAQKGAIAAIVTRIVEDVAIPQLLVTDAILAVQQVSEFWRSQQHLSACVLVTGSNGKTSIKEMLTSCFRHHLGHDQVCATQGNLNNHLGLPLSLLSLRSQHQIGVFEVGANHLGEIAQIAPLARPTAAIISSIGLAHIGEFGGLDQIKLAKSEVFTALPDESLVVVPVLVEDNPLDAWHLWQPMLTRLSPIVFGDLEVIKSSRGWQKWIALVSTHIEQQEDDQLWQVMNIDSSEWGSAEIKLPILGRHQAMNAVAVSALLLASGLTWKEIQGAMLQLSLPKGRLSVERLFKDCLLIDDSYNANPSSMIAAVHLLADMNADQRFLVLGDMAELGNDAEEGHRLVGLSAREYGIDYIYALGKHVEDYQSGFAQEVCTYVNHEELAKHIWQKIVQLRSAKQRLVVLVKGSRSSQMEQVIQRLICYRDNEVSEIRVNNEKYVNEGTEIRC